MSLILKPDDAADADAFDGIRDLANITADNDDINGNPLFMSAEGVVIANVPSAALGPDAMSATTARTAAIRPQVVLALQFLTAAYLSLIHI